MMSQQPQIQDVFRALNDSPMQRKLRRLRPFPAGVVFIQRPGTDEAQCKKQFQCILDIGFNCLKGIVPAAGTSMAQLKHWALDIGLIPWWYGEAGYEEPTIALLQSLGIDTRISIQELRIHPDFLAYQRKRMRARIEAESRDGGRPLHTATDKEAHRPTVELESESVPQFAKWLAKLYDSPRGLWESWNMHHAGIPGADTPWENWKEMEEQLPTLLSTREYRRIRDLLRFKADRMLERIREKRDAALAIDPNAPIRSGGEMGLFLPFAGWATDMEGIAHLMAEGGSFYPSIHLSWHFEESGYSAVPEVFLQASLVQDWFKGGWTATWESTGGPQQLSGGKGLHPGAEAHLPGFTVDAGVMTQLMLSYLGAGLKGFGLWCWNARTAGWEAGEFSLLDRNDRVGPRALRAGAIARLAQEYRDELWECVRQPMVGVYTDFDSEAIWEAVSRQGREAFRHMGVQGRIGATRALTRANVPWEHASGRDLRLGLAARYQILYLPSVLSISSELLQILRDFAAGGGRVVADCPSFWLDEHGRTFPTGRGSLFENLFGCTLDDFQYARNVPRQLGGSPIEGFTADLTLTTGNASASFAAGGCAVCENRIGMGSAALLAYEASQLSYKRRSWAEARLVTDVMGSLNSPIVCEDTYVFRLLGQAADHLFVVNDAPARDILLKVHDRNYSGLHDLLSDAHYRYGESMKAEAYGGLWLRAPLSTD